MNQIRCDALIVGGGPAGIAAALALHQRGIDCLLADASVPPIEKACGEGLMPDSLAVLSRLGINLAENDGAGAIFNGISFLNSTHAASASFPAGSGIGIRRLRLHSLLLEAAQHAGVPMLWGHSAVLNSLHSATLGDTDVRFRYLIGADGQSSTIRRTAGLDATHGNPIVRYGFRRHYRVQPWSPNVEIHWGAVSGINFGASAQIYITPVGREEVCVAVISRDHRLRLNDALTAFPLLQRHLCAAEITSRERGSASVHRHLRRVAQGHVALIGDASGSADAITGEGMANSFRQALALADAIASATTSNSNSKLEPLAAYERAHRQIMALPMRMSRLMLYMDRYPALEKRALAAFASDPALFARMLSVHVAHESFAHFLTHAGPRLGMRLLMPQPSS